MDPAIAAWLAGVATWSCALGFDYRKRGTQFESDKRDVETRRRLKDLSVEGDIDEYVANNFGRPTFGDSASRTYAEPLFVSTIVGWTTIHGGENVAWILGLQVLITLGLVGTTGAWSPWWMRTRYFIGSAWLLILVVLALCSWLSHEKAASLLAWVASLSAYAILIGVLAAFLGGILLGSRLRRSMTNANGPPPPPGAD